MSRRERANRQRNHALENTFALGTEGETRVPSSVSSVPLPPTPFSPARNHSFGGGVFFVSAKRARDARGRKIRNNTRAGAEVRCKKLVLFL